MSKPSSESASHPTGPTTSKATISGGAVGADLDRLSQTCATLSQSAQNLEKLGAQWSGVADSIHLTLLRLQTCFYAATQPETHGPGFEGRANILAQSSQNLCTQLSASANRYRQLSDLVARACGYYSAADTSLLGGLASLFGTSAGTVAGPTGIIALGVSAFLAGGGNETAAQILHRSDGMQNGIMKSGAQWLNWLIGKRPGDTRVGDAAANLVPLEVAFEDLFMGDRLVVSEPHPSKGPVRASGSVGDALANLDRLTAPGSGVDYGTMAVQKYVDADGTTRWLVLIPGTDTHWNTAVGWGQNLELMSSNNSQRMHADSVRLLCEAMKRSGIKPGDPVTLVGHSQGGIVAASAAAGLKNQYNITHVVTAGSPIANHPVPATTWVTSVENEGELVSNLDGEANPSRPNWLTVRGSVDVGNQTSPPLPGEATPVPNAPGHVDITHALNYQRATWSNAEALGSHAVQESERHFEEQVRGHLESTKYYTGRMTY